MTALRERKTRLTFETDPGNEGWMKPRELFVVFANAMGLILVLALLLWPNWALLVR